MSIIEAKVLGNKIKDIRVEKGLTIKELAELVDVSASMLSQIERGLANPSLNTLRSISTHLGVPMFSFFNYEDTSSTSIVRKEQRVRIIKGKSDSDEFELGYDLLSPDLDGVIQLCEMSLASFQYSADKLNNHDAEEVAVCTEGSIELVLEGRAIMLNCGDSIRIEKGTPHRWKNPTDKKCSIIFALSPPTF